jgi:hypothetical protein
VAIDEIIWNRLGESIISTPDDDDIRSAYAAEIESYFPDSRNAHLRAEFIRMQLTLAHITSSHPEWTRLASRVRLLESREAKEWIPEPFRASGIQDQQFYRGFLEKITIPAPSLVELNSAAFQMSPIEHLNIINMGKNHRLAALLKRLAKNGLLDRLVSLVLDGQGLDDRDADALIYMHCPRLKWLSLAYNRFEQKGVSRLVERFALLKYVDLGENPGDPHEKLWFDQGYVSERRESWAQATFPRVAWLKRRVIGGRPVRPSRFRMNRPRSAGQFLPSQ